MPFPRGPKTTLTRIRETTLAALADEVDRMKAEGVRKDDGTAIDGPWLLDAILSRWLSHRPADRATWVEERRRTGAR